MKFPDLKVLEIDGLVGSIIGYDQQRFRCLQTEHPGRKQYVKEV